MKSRLSDVIIPDCTIHDLVLGDLQGYADHVAMVDGVTGESFTFKDMKRLSEKVASGMVKLGVKKGDVVLIMSQNNPYFAIAMFAILRIGAIVTTVNPEYTAYEIEAQLQDSGTSYIYTMEHLAPKAHKAARRGGNIKEIISLGGGSGCIPFSHLLADDGHSLPHHVTHDLHTDTAFILYSSGTTGLPKGVCITHRNSVANTMLRSHPKMFMACFYSTVQAQGGQIVQLGYLPFFHIFGLSLNVIHSFYTHTKIITLPKVVPKSFLGTIEKYKVNLLYAVPPIVLMLVKNPLVSKYDLSCIKILASGGAPLDIETENAVRKLLPGVQMLQAYGMTEALTICGKPEDGEKEGSVGVLSCNTEIKLVDIVSGQEVGEGQRGEVWVRGPQVMKGYLNKPKATHNTIDAQGWLHTGDVAYYDNAGHFYIVGRIKELIKVKGFQVAPAELEAVLLTHPAVADVGVIGLPHARSGEVPRAFIVRKSGNSHVTAQDIQTFVKEKLIHYKWLTGGVGFINTIPKTPSGKILRRKLTELYETQKSKL